VVSQQARPRYGHHPPPPYPQIARRRGWQGTVEYEVQVLRSGAVGDLQLRTSSGHKSLDEAARRAIIRWRFTPATVDGNAVESWVVIPVSFVLDADDRQ
jgi:protein TonB